MKLTSWASAVVCTLAIMALTVMIARPFYVEHVWQSNAENIGEGMMIEDVLRLLGPGERLAKSTFPPDQSNEGVTEYYFWNKGHFSLEVGVKNDNVQVARKWYRNF